MKILTWGICFVVFCLPMYLVRLVVFGVPTTILELMVYLLFIMWLIRELRIKNQESWVTCSQRFVIRNSSFIIPIILIIIGVSLATIFSSDLRTSAGIWKAWFIDPLLFFIVVVTVIKNLSQVRKVLCSLFLSGTVVSIISLIYLIQGKLDPVGRLQAFFNSPNYLAMYLAPVLIIGFGYLSSHFPRSPSLPRLTRVKAGALAQGPTLAPPRQARGPCPLSCGGSQFKSLLAAFILLFVILFFTKSFGAWFGIIAAVCFGLLLYLFKLRKTRLALIILCLGLVIVLVLGYFALTQRESSLDARLVIWQKAWQVFKTHPVLGIGPGTFGNHLPSYPEWGVPQPHNLYLAFLLQAGILGFVGFVWLLIWFFKNGVKLLTARCSLFAVILMSTMVCILIHGLFDTTYWKNDLSVIFWIIVALMVVVRNKVALDNNSFSNS